jgi:hypothetical protein
MMSTGRDVSGFFPSVVLNIQQDSFEVKVLVYMYLVRTAEHKPDEALLSINSFQKDLAHPNPRVRALALRVMSSIRVAVIVPVVILAVRKCAVDPSPYVRKAAAHAIPKVARNLPPLTTTPYYDPDLSAQSRVKKPRNPEPGTWNPGPLSFNSLPFTLNP